MGEFPLEVGLTKADQIEAKKSVGEHAASYIQDGMMVGLGTGSTVYWTLQKLGQMVADGLRISCIPTSRQTGDMAEKLGIPLTSFAAVKRLDIAIDGADEIDPAGHLIKGGGGALLREKLVASAADTFVVVADASKYVQTLGAFPLPVEITPFAWELTKQRVESLRCSSRLREVEGAPYITDNANYILDCAFSSIPDPGELHARLKQLPGVVETGLFVGMTDIAIVGNGQDVEVRQFGP